MPPGACARDSLKAERLENRLREFLSDRGSRPVGNRWGEGGPWDSSPRSEGRFIRPVAPGPAQGGRPRQPHGEPVQGPHERTREPAVPRLLRRATLMGVRRAAGCVAPSEGWAPSDDLPRVRLSKSTVGRARTLDPTVRGSAWPRTLTLLSSVNSPHPLLKQVRALRDEVGPHLPTMEGARTSASETNSPSSHRGASTLTRTSPTEWKQRIQPVDRTARTRLPPAPSPHHPARPAEASAPNPSSSARLV